MSDKILIDTNLWVYLYAKTPATKYRKIKTILDESFDAIIFSTINSSKIKHKSLTLSAKLI
jgi:hypothetical protein